MSKSDGYRVLVDRLWPRGIKKRNCFYKQMDERGSSVHQAEKVV